MVFEEKQRTDGWMDGQTDTRTHKGRGLMKMINYDDTKSRVSRFSLAKLEAGRNERLLEMSLKVVFGALKVKARRTRIM